MDKGEEGCPAPHGAGEWQDVYIWSFVHVECVCM